jgi:glycosyltransferase involved in cell wall biosynthesis
VSPDGLSTALGQSQLLALTERLQSMEWQCTILSLEPASVDIGTLESLHARVAASGIRWRYMPYRAGRFGAAKNAQSIAAMIRDVRDSTDLFHCRSYFGAFFPCVGGLFGGVPYVFDTRGYWVDEKILAGRWFQDFATRAVARRVEQELYNRASAVVSLTELAAQDVRKGLFGRSHPDHRSVCIPTCVDYTKFTMERGVAPHEFLRDGPIIAYVGSLNPSYEYRASLRVVQLILDRIPRAKFLALTSQTEAMSSLASEFAIPPHRCFVTTVAHNELHHWLPWIDFGLMLLVSPNQAKRASMPTKLAEFFATGVAPIAHGANSEVTDWVRRAGTGVVLEDLSSGSLERVAEAVAKGLPEADALVRARRVAEEHFSLDFGAERYDQLFRDVLTS